MSNEEHNRYIAFAFLVNAGFYLLILGFVFLMFFFVAFSAPGDPGPPAGLFAFMFTFMAVFYGMFMLPSIIAGYGLLKKKSWARTASIIAAVVAGMNFPIGTGACTYALWFFFSENWKDVYPEQALPNELKEISYGVESQRAAYAQAEHEPRFNPYNPPDWR